MARFSSRCLIPNLVPQTLNILLYATTIQDKDIVIAVELDTETENAKF